MAFLRVTLVAVLVVVLTGGSLLLDVFRQGGFVVARSVFADINLTGMSREEVREVIHQRTQSFLDTPFELAARGKVTEVTMRDFGIVFNESEILDEVMFSDEVSNPELILWTIAGRRVTPKVHIEPTEVLRIIDEKFPTIPKVRNASFIKNGKELEIVEAKVGYAPRLEPLVQTLLSQSMFYQTAPVVVEFDSDPPQITAADLEEFKDSIIAEFPKSLKLTNDGGNWTVDFQKNPEWITLQRAAPSETNSFPFVFEWSPLEFAKYVNENLSPKLEQQSDSVRVFKDEKGDVQFEGRPHEGRAIPRESLLAAANKAIKDKGDSVEVALDVITPKVEISSDFAEMGIKELIAVGYTRYEGSPANRKHNITVGAAKYNGVLIAPGEEFSFNKRLGAVDASTGYKPELVIKAEGTIPEYGGGLCQVSTTFYRGVLEAGLPITERSPHSYAVSYYAQVGGHGLDATIYPGVKDLKFKNDTPGYILIQSYTDGDSAYFNLYGTSDGRKVALEGPTIFNRVGVPSQSINVADDSLSPGAKVQVEKPHAGFDSEWFRTITKQDGESIRERIFSHYRAMPAKYKVGPDVAAAEPTVDPSLVPTNPFE